MNDKEIETMLEDYIKRGYLNLDPRNKNNIICYYKEDENMTEGFYSVSIKKVASSLSNDIENFKSFKSAMDDALENNITLTDFLNIFEFDYTIVNSDDNMKYIKLIDLTSANLGDIENEYFDISSEGVLGIINRLESYIQDYIFYELEEILESKYNLDVSKMSWKELDEVADNLHYNYAFKEFVPYIFLDKELKLDAINKMIINDIEFEYSIKNSADFLEEIEEDFVL